MFEDTNQTEVLAEDTNPQEEQMLPYSLFQQEEGLTVKYNGEEKTLPIEEAKAMAQKGLNYDHIYAQRQDAHRVLDAIAAQRGITREMLIAESEGKDLNTLRWEALLKAYPEIKVEDLPREVFCSVGDGASPVEAYQKHLIEELELKLRLAKGNRENKERAIGSLQSRGAEPRDNFLEGFYGAKY